MPSLRHRRVVHEIVIPAALQSARARRPDVVLTDVMTPSVDGLALMRALCADVDLCVVPVILLSARAGEESRIEGLEAGADDYLVKPFSARELLASVRTQLRVARSRRLSREVLHASEERHRALVTASSDVVYQMNADWSLMQPLDGRNLVASNSTPLAGWMEKNVPGRPRSRLKTGRGGRRPRSPPARSSGRRGTLSVRPPTPPFWSPPAASRRPRTPAPVPRLSS